MGGYDRDGPQLYMIEPSGVAYVGPQSPGVGFVHPNCPYSFLTKFIFHINVHTKLLTLLSLFFSYKVYLPHKCAYQVINLICAEVFPVLECLEIMLRAIGLGCSGILEQQLERVGRQPKRELLFVYHVC